MSLPTPNTKILDVYLNYGLGLRKQKHLEVKVIETKNKQQILSEINRVTHI